MVLGALLTLAARHLASVFRLNRQNWVLEIGIPTMRVACRTESPPSTISLLAAHFAAGRS
jgi:hypothetical protein